MSDTRILKSAKGLLLLIFLALPLFSSFLPEFSLNSGIVLNTKEPLSGPKSAAIPNLGYGQFWVNGTQLQENNTLYAQVGDILHIDIETGTGIPSSIPVTFQQIGGASYSFSGGTLTKSGSSASGDVTIDSGLTTAQTGIYRVTLTTGKGFSFHVNITHAPPLITDITMWDTLYKTDKESVLEGSTYENYRNTNIYANITYKLRSTALSSPSIIMSYNNGTGSQMNVTVPSSSWPGSGTFTCAAPAIVTTPNQNNQWRPGDYPLNFTISYVGVLDTFAEINLRILNIPPNITSFSLTPSFLPLPTTTPQNASVQFAIQDPDDDILYGSSDTSVKMVRGGDLDVSQTSVNVNLTQMVSPAADMAKDDLNYTAYACPQTALNYITFQVLLDTTNLTNIDSSTAYFGLKIMKNTSIDTGAVYIFDNASQVWSTNQWNFQPLLPGIWLYNQIAIPTPYTRYMGINQTRSFYIRLAVQSGSSDFSINVDLLNVTYNTTLRPCVSGVIFTLYSPYIRAQRDTNDPWLNETLSYDVTECYDDASNQWMFNLSFYPGLQKGPYSIRVEVYDHGTAPYRPFSDPIDRDAFATYREVYSAGYAIATRNLMLGDTTNSNVTKIQKAPRWGSTATGMTVNRGAQVGLVVEVDDNAFSGSFSEPGTGFPFSSNVTDTSWSVGDDWPLATGLPTFANTYGSINNTYLAGEGAYCNISLNGSMHGAGINNFHMKFTLDKYYFVLNSEITSLRLDVRAGIVSGSMSNTIDFGRLQVFNVTSLTWINITTVLQNTEFIKFNTFSDAFTWTFNSPDINDYIHPQSREIWFRLQYNESSQANADNYGLNLTIDYLQLTVSSYTHAKKVVALLTQDLVNFYWFVMGTTSPAGASTVWSVTIPTNQLPAGTYDLTIRTQTLFNGVNYNFTGRLSSNGPLHITQDWQGLLFKNTTLKVNPTGVSIALSPGWVNKTVIRAKPAALNLQGTYSVSYGKLAQDEQFFRLEVRIGSQTAISRVYVNGGDLESQIKNFAHSNGNWWANISFAASSPQWPSGLSYFRLWLEADDGAVGTTGWQEMYVIAAPPFVYLQPDFPAVLDVWRNVVTENYDPINITDFDTTGFLNIGGGSAQVILEARNRSSSNIENFGIWTMENGKGSQVGSNFIPSGNLLVNKDVANATFDNFTLVAQDNDILWPQVSIVRLSGTFHILNNPPQVNRVNYNTTTTQIYRNHDVNVTIEYQDIDDPIWSDVDVKNYSAITNPGGILAFQKQNSDFLWTGSSTIRNATINFGRSVATGAYTANLTLVDPENAETVNITQLVVLNNVPVVNTLVMERNGYSEALQYGGIPSTFEVTRGDKIGFTVTLRDEEDSYLGSLRVPRVYIRLSHEDPAAAMSRFIPKYFALAWQSNAGEGVQTWSNATPFELLRSDTTFGAGTVNVEVIAQDNDGDNNSAYIANGDLPNFKVVNTAPVFIGSKPVTVSAAIEFPYLWIITVACFDWEGIYQIEISAEGIKSADNEPAPKQPFIASEKDWVYNASGSTYICSFNVTSYIAQFQLSTINVTRVTIRDWDYLVTFDETANYGAAFETMTFSDLQGYVGELPPTGDGITVLIIIVVIALIGVCAIYAVIYFRKKVSYRRYM